MHIPAMDALRHNRVGLITEGDTALLTNAYVEMDREEHSEPPLEEFTRPFPMLVQAMEPSVVEPVIEEGELKEISDELVEFISLLYQSGIEGEWVEGVEEKLEEFEGVERRLAWTLQVGTTVERPQELWNKVYRTANGLVEDDPVNANSLLGNTLRDIEGHERYGSAYLPAIDEVDVWSLFYSRAFAENDEGESAVSESLWLRYTKGESVEERPLLSYQDENSNFSIMSQHVEFGESEMDEAPAELIEAIMGDGNYEESRLPSIDMSEFADTRTFEYLEAHREEHQ